MNDEFVFSAEIKDSKITLDQLKEIILKELNYNDKVLMFIKKHFNFCMKTNFFTSTSTQFNIEKISINQYSSIINLKKINDIRYINKFFEAVNLKLPNSGFYFGTVETFRRRRKVLLDKYPPLINRAVYVFDYFLRRVLPKLKVTRKTKPIGGRQKLAADGKTWVDIK